MGNKARLRSRRRDGLKAAKFELATLLIGDTLGYLVSKLTAEGCDTSKLVVIAVVPGGVRVAKSENVSLIELSGMIALAEIAISDELSTGGV